MSQRIPNLSIHGNGINSPYKPLPHVVAGLRPQVSADARATAKAQWVEAQGPLLEAVQGHRAKLPRNPGAVDTWEPLQRLTTPAMVAEMRHRTSIGGTQHGFAYQYT